MSSASSRRSRFIATPTEICISKISRYTERKALLTYFEQFGPIAEYTFSSPTNGHVFISYENVSMADKCMTARPHYLDGKHLYVKRSLPLDDAHPFERFEDTRGLMVVIDFDPQLWNDPQFSSKLRAYFSTYGDVVACERCSETNFDYVLVEFTDNDCVDKIIMDKPHHYHEHQLNVMKHIPSNVEITNKKYASNKQQRPLSSSSGVKDAIRENSIQSDSRYSKQNSMPNEPIHELDLQTEVFRLQNDLKSMSEEFALKRKHMEEDCSQQLKQMNESAARSRSLQQDLEKQHAELLVEYASLKQENEVLNEQYLSAELENFEITSYYEQVLAEEKAKTAQPAQTQNASSANPPSPSTSQIKLSPVSTVELPNN